MQALIIGYVWPEPASSAAGKRMIQILNFLLDHKYNVTFATPSAPTPYMEDIVTMGISTISIAVNDPALDKFIENLDPALVIFDRFMMEEQFGWRVAKFCPDALRILDTEDLHFLRKSRENKLTGKLSSKDSEFELREIASIYRCDLSLIISEAEMDLLIMQYKVPSTLLLYFPFLYNEITEADKNLLSFDLRKDFICIGNLRHAPNLDAVVQLKEKIWPLIHKQLPGAQMLIYGAYTPAKIDRLHDPGNNFLVKGRAINAREVVGKARVSLVPLRFGAGLKGKLTEAMICGTPSVTTPVGAEGINSDMPWNGAITADPEEFAGAAVDLYTSGISWQIAVENGFKIINSRFSKTTFYPLLLDRINDLRDQLINHRQENFTGRMLMHHRLKSTYHLSKYIEAKSALEKLRESLK